MTRKQIDKAVESRIFQLDRFHLKGLITDKYHADRVAYALAWADEKKVELPLYDIFD